MFSMTLYNKTMASENNKYILISVYKTPLNLVGSHYNDMSAEISRNCDVRILLHVEFQKIASSEGMQ